MTPFKNTTTEGTKPMARFRTLLVGTCLCLLLGSLHAQESDAQGQAIVSITNNGVQVNAYGVSATNGDDARTVIQEQLGLATDTAPSEPLADDMAFFLQQRLFQLGHADAVVDWELGSGAIVLKVSEGPRYTVGNITYEGNTSQPENELTSYLLRPTHEKLGAATDHPPFVEVDLRDGMELVQRYLLGRGYLDATVEGPFFTPRPETSTQDVLLKLREGRIYTIGEITFTGDLQQQEKEAAELIKDLPGQAYNEVTIETTRKHLVGIYQRLGHFKAEVIATSNPSSYKGGPVPVTYKVLPGKRYRIAGVQIAPGFSDGAARILRSSFKPSVGRVYSPTDLETMNLRAVNTDVFSRLDVTPTTITDDQLTLEITGEEGPTRTVGFYGGYETFQGALLGGELRKVNIFDSGNTMRLKAEISALGINGNVQWINPALFESPYTLNLQIGAETVEVFDYERRSLMGRATFGRQWNRNISTNIFVEGSHNTSESDALLPEELGPDEYPLGLLGAAIVLDYRDNPALPVKGWYASAGVTTAQDLGGGEVSYLRTDLAFSYYQPITKKFRAAVNARTSAIQNDKGVEGIPIDLRLFNGGANSVRSFQEREMGVKSKTSTPLGGTLSQVFSVEFSYEVVTNLELAAFGDAGRLSRDEDSVFTGSGSNDLRYAVGMGIRYKLPVGPLRIDYGYNPDKEEGESSGALHITFGFAF